MSRPRPAPIHPPPTKVAVHTMNTNRIKGAAKNAVGKLQQKAGKAVGSKLQEAKGLRRQAAGKLQERLGEDLDAAKKSRNARPR